MTNQQIRVKRLGQFSAALAATTASKNTAGTWVLTDKAGQQLPILASSLSEAVSCWQACNSSTIKNKA